MTKRNRKDGEQDLKTLESARKCRPKDRKLTEQDQDKEPQAKGAFITLLTKPFYFPAVVVLAFTLRKHAPKAPLLIAYTPLDFSEAQLTALQAEAQRFNAILCPIEHLRSADEAEALLASNLTAAHLERQNKHRFADIWTKFQVFMLHDREEAKGFDYLCYLDADMVIFSDPSPIVFSPENTRWLSNLSKSEPVKVANTLPPKGTSTAPAKRDSAESSQVNADPEHRLLAVPECYCIEEKEFDIYPPHIRSKNCPLAALQSLSGKGQIPQGKSEMFYFNSGVFVFAQSRMLAAYIKDALAKQTPKKVRSYQYPDQDVLNELFMGNWKSLPVGMNAYKVLVYKHPKLWQEASLESMIALHVYCNKPWRERVRILKDGRKAAGHEGRDGQTHSLWWDAYEQWLAERRAQNESQTIDVVSEFVVSS